MTAIRLATRRSPLALAQATQVARSLEAATGRAVELVPTVSAGDRSRASLQTIGGTGVFVAAVRDAVLAGAADVAVHSLKDLPTLPHDGLILAAVPPREDPRDALVTAGPVLADLPAGAVVGTGSPRRAAQLRALRPDLDVVDIRGNVDSRIALVDGDTVAAVVLALAGLRRLGREDRVRQVFAAHELLPAPGQAALAVEARVGDTDLHASLTAIDDADSRAAVTAERALLRRLEAGCTAPVGALGTIVGDQILLHAAVFDATGASSVTTAAGGAVAAAADVGRRAAEQLLGHGADRLVGGPVR